MPKIKSTVYLMIIFILLLTGPCAYARDILSQIHPYIGLTGEYNDNLYLSKENKKRDFIGTVTPGIRFDNMDAQSGITLDANAGAVFHNDYSNLNYISGNINFNSKYMTSSHFNFYLRNSYTRSDDPREREFFTTTADNKFVLATETSRGIYWRNMVEPTVEYQFGPESRIGVMYRNNVYQTAAAGAENSIENYASPFMTWWINRQNGISLSYAFTNGHFENQSDFNSHKANASYMLRFTPKATASLNGGYTNQKYVSGIMDYSIYESSLGLSYLFSPTLSASAQVGYYWMTPDIGDTRDGLTFKADITQRAERTTFVLSLQGGYTQDVFTSQNLGFRKYYRATGSINHFLARQFSIGCLGSVERSESEPRNSSDPDDPGQLETIWGAGANAAYQPFQWLRIALQYTYNQRNANYRYESVEYTENRGMLTLTATY